MGSVQAEGERVLPPRLAAARRAPSGHVLTGLTVAVVVAGLAVRLVAALAYRGVIYPDETYQMTEPAHRLVFGYGVTAWEFRTGTRSWLGPGLLLPPTLLWRWLGLDGVGGPGLVRAWVALGAGVGIAAAALLARRLAGTGAGLLAAALVAFSPLGAVYEAHPLADIVAAPLMVSAVALLAVRGRVFVAAALAGALLVAALVLRPQLLPIVLAVGLATVLGSGRRRVLPLALGGALALVADAVLDTLTWGVPFAPLWRTFQFNVVDDGASRWGESPWPMYLTWVVRVDGPVLALVLAAGLLLACRRPRGGPELQREAVVPGVLVAGLVAFLGVLSAIGHKELRFLLPGMPLAGALAAVGLARWLPVGLRALARRRAAVVPHPGVALGALAAVTATAGMLALPGLTMADLGYPRPGSAWRGDDATPRLLGEVGRLPDVCGVVVLSEGLTWSGGFTALHRDVPLATKRGARDVGSARAWANVVITFAARPLPTGYRPVAADGDQVAAQRPGSCAPPPANVARRWI